MDTAEYYCTLVYVYFIYDFSVARTVSIEKLRRFVGEIYPRPRVRYNNNELERKKKQFCFYCIEGFPRTDKSHRVRGYLRYDLHVRCSYLARELTLLFCTIYTSIYDVKCIRFSLTDAVD